MNMEGIWNVFSGENHIDCPGLHCPGLHCTWFTGDIILILLELVSGQ